ncbi:DUF6285 domain-containing protein [Nocardia sp. NPDC004722]
MQYRPTAPELLTALADLLETTLLPALPPELRHQARVGAHLARMLERELTLAPASEPPDDTAPVGPGQAAARFDTTADLGTPLGAGPSDGADLRDGLGRFNGPGEELVATVGAGDEVAGDETLWAALVRVVRADLAVAKPGYDAWEGE